jgi:YgiT-type zinc finger domain-containing protein
MKCVICRHGETQPGTVTVTLERGGATLIFKGVPARICDNCGESYLDEAVTTQLLEAAQVAQETGVQVEIRAFVAA